METKLPKEVKSTYAFQEEKNAEADEKRLNEDGKQLLKIFPQEIWEKILKEVQTSKDQENLCNASLFFRYILSPQLTLALFPKVLETLYQKYHQKEALRAEPEVPKQDENGEEIRYKLCRDCDLYSVHWWFSQTLSIRLACKTWRSSVDKFIESAYNNTSDAIICEDWDIIPNFELDGSKAISFLTHFKKTHHKEDNPFLGRKVRILLVEVGLFGTDSVNRRQEIPAQLSCLLSKYGEHIWYCEIYLERSSESYLELRQVLKMMPNLKRLQVSYAARETSMDGELDQLRSYTESHPLPELVQLQVLHLTECPEPLFNALVQKYHNISGLRIMTNIGYILFSEVLFGGLLPNLNQIHIDTFRGATLGLFLMQLCLLLGSDVNFRLNQLTLNFSSLQNPEWSIIFQSLKEKWADTLTSLEITLPFVEQHYDEDRFIDTYKSLRLELPFLTNLTITMGLLTSLDFLLPMKKSLKFLDISMNHGMGMERRNEVAQKLENGQTTQVLMYTDRMMESNIWDIFPKLQRISWCEKHGQSVEEEDSYFRAIQYRK